MIELRISGEAVTVEAVLALLLKLDVDASATATSNVVKDEHGRRRVEPGVHLLLPECSQEEFKRTVWPSIKEAFSLRCGWMDASTKSYRGCTENYLSLNSCPYKNTAEDTETTDVVKTKWRL